MSTLPTETRATPVLPFGMTAEELLDAVCPAPRRYHLDEQGEAVVPPSLTVDQARLLRAYPKLLDGFAGRPIHLDIHETEAVLQAVDRRLAPGIDAGKQGASLPATTRTLSAPVPLRGARTLPVAAQPLRGAR